MQDFKIACVVVGGIFGVGLLTYAVIAWASFLISDPFDIVTDPTPVSTTTNRYQVDINRCRELGGYPVTSGWNGRLLECKEFDLTNEEKTL